MKILVVDDVQFTCIYLQRVLEHFQHTVLVAYDAGEAIRTLHKHPDIDIVITDQYMPDMKGTELYQHVLGFDIYNGIDAVAFPPFILITANWEKDLAEHALTIGIKRVFEKPLLPTELMDCIDSLKSIGEPENALHLYVADPKGQTHRLVASMLDDTEHQVHQVSYGSEILQAIDEGSTISVVLAEYDLEDMSGPKLYKRMRALQYKILGDQKAGNLIPFLLVVEELTPEQTTVIRDAGIRDVLTKPLDMTTMAEKLSTLNNRNSMMSSQRKKDPDAVLVIDDVGFNQVMIERSIRHLNYAVFKAGSAYEAMDIFKQKSNIKAVVCDLMLPGLDGIDFYRYLKSNAEFDVPEFLLVTACEDKARLSEARRTGFFDVLPKPIDPIRLVDLVSRMVGGQTAAQYQDEITEATAPKLPAAEDEQAVEDGSIVT